MEAYINDMVVKSGKVFEHLGDLDEVFLVLRKYKLHLRVGSRKFLAFMITH